MFQAFLGPSSGAQNCTHSIGYMSSLLAAIASDSIQFSLLLSMLYMFQAFSRPIIRISKLTFQLTRPSDSSKQA